MTTITIPRRYNGPLESGNGGYTCGAVATAIGETVRVRLKLPPPLETPLVLRDVGEEWHLVHGDAVVATAAKAAVDIVVPQPPTFEQALDASRHYPSPEDHDLPHCFVCGPARQPGDGLRVFAARVAGSDAVAAPWVPSATFAQEGAVRPEFVWAALDCPGAFASHTDKPMLLGELTARIDRRPNVDERCVVIGWRLGHEGRKHYAGTAVVGADGNVCAVGSAIWIELKA